MRVMATQSPLTPYRVGRTTDTGVNPVEFVAFCLGMLGLSIVGYLPLLLISQRDKELQRENELLKRQLASTNKKRGNKSRK